MAELYLPLGNGTSARELSVSLRTDGLQSRWYATYTAARHEKTALQHLQSREIETFLPIYDSARRWENGRRAVVQMPLFPSYLFVRISTCERQKVLEAPGIIRIVGFNGQLAPLRDDEIAALRAAVQVRKSQPHPFLSAGKRVRVTAGALRGLEGVIVRSTRELKMIVSIDSIMRSFSVELEPSDVEACISTLAKRAG
ncbi:MAG TPA: UpxY family transcription antiterminator [Clostridia bacterium]|nr:UpxY family transcription antiterminator [Clostridia bacterium]